MPEPGVNVVRGERRKEPVGGGRTERTWSPGKEEERIWGRGV